MTRRAVARPPSVPANGRRKTLNVEQLAEASPAGLLMMEIPLARVWCLLGCGFILYSPLRLLRVPPYPVWRLQCDARYALGDRSESKGGLFVNVREAEQGRLRSLQWRCSRR